MALDSKDSPSSATFWDYLDQLVTSCSITIDRPRNSTHPHYPEIIYPLDYGYLDGTIAIDGGGLDVWLGASGSHDLVSIIITVDLYKHDAEVKLLLGCTEEEMQIILDFHNGYKTRAILIHRPTSNLRNSYE